MWLAVLCGVSYLYITIVVLPTIRSGLIKPPALAADASRRQVFITWARVIATALFLSPRLSAKKHKRAPQLPTHAVTNRELLRIARTAHVMSPTPDLDGVALLETDDDGSSDDDDDSNDDDEDSSTNARGRYTAKNDLGIARLLGPAAASVLPRGAAVAKDSAAAAAAAAAQARAAAPLPVLGPRALARVKSAPALIEKLRASSSTSQQPTAMLLAAAAWATPAPRLPAAGPLTAPLTCRVGGPLLLRPKNGRPGASPSPPRRWQSRSPPRPGGRRRRRRLTVVLDLDECLIHSTFHGPEDGVSGHDGGGGGDGGDGGGSIVGGSDAGGRAGGEVSKGSGASGNKASGDLGGDYRSVGAGGWRPDKYRQAEDRPETVAVGPDSFRLALEDGDSVTVNCRPGLRDFLEQLAQQFHTVVFTAGREAYASRVLDFLDPEGRLFHQRLYRQSCREARGGIFLKDLACVAAEGGGGGGKEDGASGGSGDVGDDGSSDSGGIGKSGGAPCGCFAVEHRRGARQSLSPVHRAVTGPACSERGSKAEGGNGSNCGDGGDDVAADGGGSGSSGDGNGSGSPSRADRRCNSRVRSGGGEPCLDCCGCCSGGGRSSGGAGSPGGGRDSSSSGGDGFDVLSRTVLVDNSPFSLLLQPSNGILVSSYFDDPADNALPSVLQLLQHLDHLDDVRPTLAQLFCLGPILEEYRTFVLHNEAAAAAAAAAAATAAAGAATETAPGAGSTAAVTADAASGAGAGGSYEAAATAEPGGIDAALKDAEGTRAGMDVGVGSCSGCGPDCRGSGKRRPA